MIKPEDVAIPLPLAKQVAEQSRRSKKRDNPTASRIASAGLVRKDYDEKIKLCGAELM
jgi:hypothetical protein